MINANKIVPVTKSDLLSILANACLLCGKTVTALTASAPGVFAISTRKGRQIFITGHPEYDAGTLKKEYLRDVAAGKPIEIPKNYFPGDDPEQEPIVSWRSSANLLYSNWLNYFVYQTTPYDLSEIK